jgi:hypothetical protein
MHYPAGPLFPEKFSAEKIRAMGFEKVGAVAYSRAQSFAKDAYADADAAVNAVSAMCVQTQAQMQMHVLLQLLGQLAPDI